MDTDCQTHHGNTFVTFKHQFLSLSLSHKLLHKSTQCCWAHSCPFANNRAHDVLLLRGLIKWTCPERNKIMSQVYSKQNVVIAFSLPWGLCMMPLSELFPFIIIIIKVFVVRKILSTETILSAYTHTQPPAHTIILTVQSLKRRANRDLDEERRMEQKARKRI